MASSADELDEVEERERSANEFLKQEKVELLKKIETLTAHLMDAESSKLEGEDEETTKLRLENDFLKSQLHEYQIFLTACMRMSERTEPSDQQTRLLKQGSESALTHFLVLISQTAGEDYQPVKMPKRSFPPNTKVVPGYNYAMCYKISADPSRNGNHKRLTFRGEYVFEDITFDVVAHRFKESWTQAEDFKKLFLKTTSHFDFKIKMIASSENGSIFSYVENLDYINRKREFIYITTETELQLPKSTLVLPAKNSCQLSAKKVEGLDEKGAITAQEAEEETATERKKKRVRTVAERSVKMLGLENCILMTRRAATSEKMFFTEHEEEEDVEGSSSSQKFVMDSYWSEGLIIFEEMLIVKGKPKLCVRCIHIWFIPDDFELQNFKGMESVIANGTITDEYAKVVSNTFNLMGTKVVQPELVIW